MRIKNITFNKLRWIVKTVLIAVIIITPFITINGQSIFRFDIATLKLYLFGATIWMEDFFIVLLALFFISFAFITITLIFGRLWCGWACPQTVLNDFVDLTTVKQKTIFKKFFHYCLCFSLSVFVSANLIWYFVSPYEFFHLLKNGHLGEATSISWIILTIIVFFNLTFVKRIFCASVCPYSKLQSIMLDDNSLIIAFDDKRKEECINCKACLKVCPVGIDIRDGLNPSCISCAECVDKCNIMTKRVGKETLIDYKFGLSNNDLMLKRPQVVIFSLITIISLAGLIFAYSTRSKLEVHLVPSTSMMVTKTDMGYLKGPYYISVSNKSDLPLELLLNLKAEDSHLRVIPDRFYINPNSQMRMMFNLLIPSNYKNNTIKIEINYDNSKKHIVKTIYIGTM